MLFLTAILVPNTSGAAEQSFSGAELNVLCTSASDIDYGYCAGYITSVANILASQSVDGYRACNHANVRSQQLVDTFRTWAEIFPDKLRSSADTAVAQSLARAFPCRT
jgi:hypothetical protein